MNAQQQVPTRLASEDVIINAPMSYAGSAQRIFRLRRRARSDLALVAITVLVIVLVVTAWVLVTAWYLIWGLLLVPYRILRRGARKRRVEMLRHRELLGTIQGSAAGSAAAFVAATTGELSAPGHPTQPPGERIADADREEAIEDLRHHMLAGRLNAVEFEDKLDALHKATTWGELRAVRADLPPTTAR